MGTMTTDWRDSGACTTGDEHPDTWFSPLPADRHRAMVTCLTRCPVRSDCLAWAHRTDQQYGVWGGIDFEVPEDERAEGKGRAARVPLLERVAAVELSYPGATMAIVAEQLGYKDAASLERTLYRKGDAGKAAIRRLKPGSRSMDEISAKATSKMTGADRDHPWLTTAAIPVRADGKNAQHRKTGQPPRRSTGTTPSAGATSTGKDTAA